MVGLALVLLVIVRALVGISRIRTWKREQDPRPVVAIANRADGGFGYWIGKLYGFAVLVACATAVLVADNPVQLLLVAHAGDARSACLPARGTGGVADLRRRNYAPG